MYLFISVCNDPSNSTDWMVSNCRVIKKLRYETYAKECGCQTDNVVMFVGTQLYS